MTTMMPLVRIVDDDAPFRTSQAMLLRMSGRDVAEYATAQDFLARDDSSRPGCLILDVRMPGMTGLELQKALEMTGSTLPVIFLTGHGDVSMAVHTMRHGAADFLEKPVMPAVLFASVERACSRSMALYASMLREREERAGFYRLTPREQQVVLLAASDTPTGRSEKSYRSGRRRSRCTAPMRLPNSGSRARWKPIGFSPASEF